MFEEMMVETNNETLKRIFRTDLTSIKSNSMTLDERAKNLKMKNDQSATPNINAPKINPQGMVNQPAGMMQSSQDFQSKILNKRAPIKADKKIGRNDKITIKKGSLQKVVKFKKLNQFIREGWQVVD